MGKFTGRLLAKPVSPNAEKLFQRMNFLGLGMFLFPCGELVLLIGVANGGALFSVIGDAVLQSLVVELLFLFFGRF